MGYRNRTQQRRHQRLWLRRRRAEWLTEHGPCRDCGSDKHLEVHHLDPSQKVSHRIWSWSKERREAELAKCIVLCRKCHNQERIKKFKNRLCTEPGCEKRHHGRGFCQRHYNVHFGRVKAG